MTVHGSMFGEMTAVISPGTGGYSPGSIGVSGGLPGSSTEHRVFRKANIDNRPHALSELAGAELEDVRSSAVPVRSEDVLYIRPDGGGGYGDPLDREPRLVSEDVALGIVSVQAATDTYGVVVQAGAADVDHDATVARRHAAREHRLGKAPRVNVSERHDVERTPYRINEYLQLSSDRAHVQCTWCGEEVCDAATPWKEGAVRREQPYAGTEQPPDGEDYVLRSYFCPACGTCLEVEGARQGDEPLHDIISDWPSS
jgi:N-methylhydantoinase B